MTVEERARAIWLELYVSVFAHSRHPKLWEAAAGLTDEEHAAIDEDAERILVSFLK